MGSAASSPRRGFCFASSVSRRPHKAGQPYRVSDLDLASRLSFFLWSSIPDEELLSAATTGTLSDRATLERQVRRMLADRRAQALVDNFASQWLTIGKLAGVVPDVDAYPEFDENLREAFRQETRLFIGSQLREDRSVTDLLTANYSFVNERLARHYRIPNVYGSHFRRVTFTDGMRGGLLGQGSILTVTSYPNRTSPVLRGRWLLDNVLGAPPPPPPPDIPLLSESGADTKATSIRQQMEAHRKNPSCAVCHVRMDPLGFSLENFDALGKWRTASDGIPVDASASLPDGTRFRGHRRASSAGGRPSGRLRAHVHAEAARLRPRAEPRGARHAGGPPDRARRGSRRVSLVVDHSGRGDEHAVHDEHESGVSGPRGHDDAPRHPPPPGFGEASRNTMLITKKAIPRRTMLRGIGATLALPLLDAMVPPLTALQNTAAKPITRFGVMYVPNGMVMEQWTPAAEGAGFELTPTLAPLAPFKNDLLVLSNLACVPTPGRPGGAHAKASTRFLTDVSPPTSETWLDAGISMDQILARQMSAFTQLGSLEMAVESGETAGACDVGFACAYTNTISWLGPSTPLPTENNPRTVFERLFGDSGSTDPRARQARIRQDRSLLDSVREEVAHLQGALGQGDRVKLVEYLEAIRDVERRIQKAEEQSDKELPRVDHPAGIPATYDDHVRLMCDLQVLAYQTDLTRVVTFMLGREFSGVTYPQIGVPDAHHPITHHQQEAEKIAKVVKINHYHVTQFAYLLEKLRATPDGDGSLLDHVIMMYGTGMGDCNAHDPRNIPLVLAGGRSAQIKGGRHIRYPKETPLANLHLTLLDKLGVHIDRMGDSTGRLDDRVLAGI